MQTLQITIGLTIIVSTYLDFFHTTLSGNGFGWLSRRVNRGLSNIILLNKSRTVFTYSGLVHLLVTTFVWLMLLFVGAFIVFTASGEMVVNETTQLPASYSERFYYTSYVLSTLGVGDFVPGNEVSEILTGILSFSGFIMLTTGMTYLLGVVNSVMSKKEMAFYISSLGGDVEELYHFFKADEDLSPLVSQSSDLRNIIIKNSSSYLSFPIVNYFLTEERNHSAVVQVAALHEVLVILRKDWKVNSVQYSKINAILNAIEYYLELGVEAADRRHLNKKKLTALRSSWRKYGYVHKETSWVENALEASLHNAGWTWNAVYGLERGDEDNLKHRRG